MELTPEMAKKIDDTYVAVSEMHTVLLGAKGNGGGLCKQVEKHDARLHRLELICAFVAGGGGITGGIIGISKLIGA
jgi:hypothetical protein